MVYHGKVKNGVIVLEGEARLPEGADVRVDLVSNGEPAAEPSAQAVPTLYESLEPLIGSLRDAPPDLARNHDHYLYGAPKVDE